MKLRTDLHEQAQRIAAAVRRTATVRSNAAADDVIAGRALWPVWAAGAWAAGAVCTHEGQPWRCVQAHDSTGQAGWGPGPGSALWASYHATDPALALPYVAPSGAHDAYQAGEYMVWTDGQTYRCRTAGTVWTPDAYPAAWEMEGGASGD